jgi:enoyl-[acyl-carrier protein] reductase I
VGSDFLIDCDVSDMAALDAPSRIQGALGDDRLRRPRDRLFGQERAARLFVDTSLENFALTMNISAYQLRRGDQRARAMMPNGGSIVTLTYYGAEKVIPHYNVMGVAKAALEDQRQISGDGSRPGKYPRQRDSRPGRSRRWRRAASAISAIS